MMGSIAWPSPTPIVEIDSALPREATNQRAIATTDRWLSMPCPKKRNAKITKTRRIGPRATNIDRQASISPTRTIGVRARTRNLSVNPPIPTSNSAEAVVPSV